MESEKQKTAVATLSVASNSFLVIAKLAVGLWIGSVSVVSEAIHSGVDLLASAIALFAVKNSGKPSDEEHPFGHGKLENISGTVEAILIFGAAIWIVYEAIQRLLHPQPLEMVGWGIGVMLVSSIINLIVSKMLFKVGKQTNSLALMADGWHLRTDVWTAVGVTIGLVLIAVGEEIFKGMHFHWVDSVAAIVVAVLIVKAAYHLTIESGRDLLDVRLPDEEVSSVKGIIENYRGEWCEYHDLRTRKSGATRFVEFHLLVAPDMSVKQSHDLTDKISDEIVRHYPGTEVNIHIEPCVHAHHSLQLS